MLLGLAIPNGYYMFLRIIITFGAIMVVINEFKNGFIFWEIAFIITAIIFNPIIPIYLNNKDVWIPIDIIGAILFGIKGFSSNNFKRN